MSIEEESFPYDSLFDGSCSPSSTKFQLVSSDTFNVFGCSSTFITDKNLTNQLMECNNDNNNNTYNNNNLKASSLKRLSSLNRSQEIEEVKRKYIEEQERGRHMKTSLDRLQTHCNYLCQKLDEKYLDIVRLKRNIDVLQIELLSSENREREFQTQVSKDQNHARYNMQISRKQEIATQTDVHHTPTHIKSAFLFVTETDNLNTTLIRKYNIQLQQQINSDHYEETVLAHSSHYTFNRSKGSVPSRGKILPGNSTRSTISGEERKSSSDQLSSSMRCSSDSAIELETVEKQQKERLRLFQRRQGFKLKKLETEKNNDKHEVARGIYGDYRVLDESESDLIPVDLEYDLNNNNNNNETFQGISCNTYAINSPTVCPNTKLLGLCNPCLQFLKRNWGQDRSYFEMNLLGKKSAVFNVNQEH